MTSGQFLELFVSLSVQVALVVIVTHWLGRLTQSETAQCRLWTGCFVGILALLVASASLPHPRLFRPWASVAMPTAAEMATLEARLGEGLFVVWGIGAAVALGLFAVQLIQTHRFLATCRPVELEDSASHGDGDNARSGTMPACATPYELLSSPMLASPFCWQFHRPCIVLPESVMSLSPHEFDLILRHEVEHLRTGHPLQLFLQRIVETLFWFHPMVWWASQQASLAREFACDDAAIDSRADIACYLRTLLKVIEQGSRQISGGGVSLHFGRGSGVIAQRAQRLVRLAQGGAARPVQPRTAWMPTSALAVITLVAATLWVPIDVLASPRANWSPWPSWSAQVLHDFGVHARDFEIYDARTQLFELQERSRALPPEEGRSRP